MNHDNSSLSLAELAGADPLRPVQAVTIVHEIISRITAGTIAGVPSTQIIRLSDAGRMTVEGPIAADAHTVGHAAHLLATLLPGFDKRSKERVPGALRLVIARGSSALDVPPYSSLEAFRADLARFAAPDFEACVRELVTARQQVPDEGRVERIELGQGASPTQSLTISDIRRARRATGLTLADISTRTGIPSTLLCELEWGYLDHWPAPPVARRLMLRYAQSAGLDEQLVLAVAWPLLEERTRERTVEPQPQAVIDAEVLDEMRPADVVPAADVVSLSPRYEMKRRSRTRKVLVAALAIPALLAIGILPVARDAEWRRHFISVMPAQTIATEMAADSRPATRPSEGVVEPTATPIPPRTEETTPPSTATTTGSGVHAVERVSVSDPPAFSPTFATVGSAVFYNQESRDRSSSMRADMDPDGSLLRITAIVDDRSHNFHARPSPDGKRIAFDSDRDGERGVYIADADGRNVRRLTGEGFAAIPSWSPDGGSLAYVRAEADKPKVWNLWMMNLGTGEERRLTSYPYGQPWGASWFPDGKRIAYSHDDRLVVLGLAGGGSRIYPSPQKGSLLRTPAVSPDGTRAVFQVYREGTWLLDFRTGVMKKVLSDPSAEEYAWAPDGRRVAYHSRSAGKWGVWIMSDSNP